MQRCLLGSSLLFGLLLSSCVEKSGIEREMEIVKLLAVDAKDEVASHTVSIMDPDPKIGQYCSGVLIAPQIVLTAAHCFQDKSRRPYVLFQRSYQPKLSHRQQGLWKARRIALHSQFDFERSDAYDKRIFNAKRPEEIISPGRPLYDLAVLYIEDPIPGSYEPVRLAGGKIDLLSGEMMTAGFGCVSSACLLKSNTLRKMPMEFIKSFPEASMVLIRSQSEHSSCRGDSGGPDFIRQNGVLRLFAIVTTGPDACESGLSLDTLLAPYGTWIEQASEGVKEGRKGSLYVLSEF